MQQSDVSKPYQIEFDYRPNYLYVYISGQKDSLAISRQFWQEIAGECKKIQSTKVLILEDIKGAISTAEMYQLATEIPQMGFYGIRIAFVDRYIEQQELNKFGEIVANNHGLRGKIFNNVEEAENWLLAD